MINSIIKKLNIFEYGNYRDYLKDMYQLLKKEKASFSFRYFSKTAGFLSPNFLKLVMEGQRNLSAQSIEKFSIARKFNKKEADFFRNLVYLNQSTTLEEKKFYADLLLKSRQFKKAHPLKKAQYEYYTNWFTIPVRELVATKNFKEDPEWIAKQLIPPIKASEAKKALQDLLDLKLIERNQEGKLVQTNVIITTGDEVDSTSVKAFHKEMIQKASESLDRYHYKKRDITCVTLGISQNNVDKLKEITSRFRKEILELAKEENTERVYQVNFQVFPLSHGNEEEVK
jgi:uncharacterized protein (TIGR02147 family)